MAAEYLFKLGFDVDTRSLQTALQEANKQLQQIGNVSTDLPITSKIAQAAQSARELQTALLNATNVNTGKLDLTQFQASLAANKKTLSAYAADLASIGPTGKTAFMSVVSAITSAEAPLTRSTKLMSSLWTTMKNTMRWQLSATALREFTSAIQSAYSYAQDLNESLTNIQIVTESSTEKMAAFAKQANAAAKALSTTTTNYTDAALIYYQQGLDDDEVEERTNATIKFANVSSQSAETASEELTAIWNNFADGSKSLEYYVDVITALGAATASSSEEISEGVQKFAAIAETTGLSYEYATAALATVTATTRQSADTVGTAFKTMFARIQDLELGETLDDGVTLGTYSEALAAVGVQILDVNNQVRDMDDILDDTAAKWETLTDATKMALAQTVAGLLLGLA